MSVAKASAASPFQNDACPVLALEQRAKVLRATFHAGAEALSKKIHSEFERFLDSCKAAGKPHNFTANLSSLRMKNRNEQEPILNASDVELEGHKYLLFGCPENAATAGQLFDAALERNVTLFVSLLQSTEAKDKFNNYWTEEQCRRIVSRQGWSFTHDSRKVLAAAELRAATPNRPELVETLIVATKGDDVRVLTHLHYQGWIDRDVMPHEGLFHILLNRIEELQEGTQAPFAINCHGGVGRTGTTAISHYFRKKIAAELGRGTPLGKIEVNIPEMVFTFRKQRRYFLQESGQLANVYSILGKHAEGLKFQCQVLQDMCSMTESLAGSIVSYGEAQATPQIVSPCPSLAFHIDARLNDFEFREGLCSLSAISACIQALQADHDRGFEALREDIALRFQLFLHQKKEAGAPHNFGRNRVDQINANYVTMGPESSYLMSASMESAKDVGRLFDEAQRRGAMLFVSMLQSGDAANHFTNFWQPDRVPQVHSPQGLTLTHLSAEVKGSSKIATITESHLQGEWRGGDEARTLTHLHYQGWPQDKEAPDEALLEALLDRIDEVQGMAALEMERDVPFVVGSRWGVGRNGVVVLCHSLRQEIRAQQNRGIPLDAVEINIPKAVFEFRKQRNGFVAHVPLLKTVYNQIARFYRSSS